MGAVLELYTKAEESDPFALHINWDDFNVEGKDLSSVPIEVMEKSEARPPKIQNERVKTGTELIIKGLRQTWIKKDIENLYDELSILTPPFQRVSDFSDMKWSEQELLWSESD